MLSGLLLLAACDVAETEPTPGADPDVLRVDPAFEYATSRALTLVLREADGRQVVRYDLYRLGADGQRHHLGATMPASDGTARATLSVPEETDRLIVRRSADGLVVKSEVRVWQDQVEATFDALTGTALACAADTYYATNNSGQLVEIDGATLEATVLMGLPYSSDASAMDPVRRRLYIVEQGRQGRMGYYDLDQGALVPVGAFGTNIPPRLAYNPRDGYLYAGTRRELQRLDPATAQIVARIPVTGAAAFGGGDFAFAPDGTLYMSGDRKLVRVDVSSVPAQATTITTDLPLDVTSLTSGSDGVLYAANNAGEFYRIDRTTGAATFLGALGVRINDLAYLPCAADLDFAVDSDADGVPDALDDFPGDPGAAFQRFAPSADQWGSLAFEDLWPSTGDYDFNDLVVAYRIAEVTNAASEVVRLTVQTRVDAVGAGYANGLGFALPFDAQEIASVDHGAHDGASLAASIRRAANGLEDGHTEAVLIAFDDAKDRVPGATGFVNTEAGAPYLPGETVTQTLTFATPRAGSVLGQAPFNPFLFRRDQRGREVHLPGQAPTALAHLTLVGTRDDVDNGYRTATGLPWALHLAEGFQHPLEAEPITDAYPLFAPWAQSGGSTYPDWYRSEHADVPRIYQHE
ncbi:MAG: LruC domain-containing protein [Bacteroidota bacterium]